MSSEPRASRKVRTGIVVSDKREQTVNVTNELKFQTPKYEFLDEKILLDNIDYYHSNVIARASKTMGECKSLRTNFKKTGTEG